MLSLFQAFPLGGRWQGVALTDEGQLLVFFHSSISLLQLPLNFSEISSEIFRKPKMCYAPHSLRFRSAPSPQGEGYNIALFQRLPLGGRLRLKVGGEGRNLFSISISLSDNVPAPYFSEISSEIFGKSKMSCAPHSLRFRSAPSPQGEG